MTLMRSPLAMIAFAAVLLSSPAAPAQSIDWQHIVDLHGPQHLPAEQFSAAQRLSMEAAIVASNTVWDDCEGDTEWPHGITVHRINLGPGHYTLAEAGVGCARSGQGANRAMWLLRWDGGTPVLLGELDGWFDAVLPGGAGNGLHDVVVGSHSNFAEYGLALYRFNGKRYRLVDDTTVHCTEGTERCIAAGAAKRP